MFMKTAAEAVQTKVADEVWIAAALLHKEHPRRVDFSIDEIMDRARAEAGSGELRPGVYVHVVQHCVANRAPNPGRYRMLYETAPGRRRLFRPGDTYHSAREKSKTVPFLEEMEVRYKPLIRWYNDWTADARSSVVKNDPLLSLYGSGKDLWADEHPDKYVRRLREGWE